MLPKLKENAADMVCRLVPPLSEGGKVREFGIRGQRYTNSQIRSIIVPDKYVSSNP